MADDRNRFGDNDDFGGDDRGWRRDYEGRAARDYGAGNRDDRNFRGGGTGYAGGPFGGRDEYRGGGGEFRSGGGGGGDRYRMYGHDGERFTEHGGREEYSRTGNWGGNQDWQREQPRGGGQQQHHRDRGYGGGNEGGMFGSRGGSGGGMFGGGSGGGGGGMFGGDHRSSGGGSWFSGNDHDDRHRGPSGGQRGYSGGGSSSADRGFFDRAGDEVRSWFGDEEAERRRRYDQQQDEAMGGGARGGHERDEHYHNWRREQIAQLDRDYDEYRREHGTKFRNEFGTWRNERQTQRECLNRVNEHMEVVGSDGQHVGTVDKVQGDRILLTKNDADAGGRHHSIPSRWIDRVEDKVMIRKTADEAKREWRDEERNSAFFGDEGGARTGDADRANESDTMRAMRLRQGREQDDGNVDLNRSFSGTYKKD